MEHETLQQHEDTLVMVIALANLIGAYDKKLAEARAAEMWESLVEMPSFACQD